MDYQSGYAHYLTEEKRASANTLSSYLRDVTQYLHWLEGEGVPPEQAAQKDVESYTRFLSAKGKSAATVTRSLASLKSFYSYLIAEGRVSVNPARGLAPAKVERKLPHILTSKEVELFLEQPDASDAKGCRDRAMLELLYATGIRVSELIGLDLENVNLSAGFIRCSGRGKERMIPLYPAAVRALQDYIEHVRPQMLEHPQERALFVNMSGERMSRQGFWKIIKALSGEGRNSDRNHPSHPAPLLCRPSAGKRRGSPLHPGDAGTRGHFVHPDLCPVGQPEAEGCLQQSPPESLTDGPRRAAPRPFFGLRRRAAVVK